MSEAPQIVAVQPPNEVRVLTKMLKPGGCRLGTKGESYLIRISQDTTLLDEKQIIQEDIRPA